jgi:ribose 5-phosphate isomerase RpiB
MYSACASSTRAVHSAGYISQTAMGYVTIASTGNATEFGTYSSRYANWALSNKTRGVFGCGTGSGMAYITIATTGNALSFGTELNTSARTAGASDCGGGVA